MHRTVWNLGQKVRQAQDDTFDVRRDKVEIRAQRGSNDAEQLLESHKKSVVLCDIAYRKKLACRMASKLFLFHIFISQKSLEKCLRVDPYKEVVGVVDVIARIIVEGLVLKYCLAYRGHTCNDANFSFIA